MVRYAWSSRTPDTEGVWELLGSISIIKAPESINSPVYEERDSTFICSLNDFNEELPHKHSLSS